MEPVRAAEASFRGQMMVSAYEQCWTPPEGKNRRKAHSKSHSKSRLFVGSTAGSSQRSIVDGEDALTTPPPEDVYLYHGDEEGKPGTAMQSFATIARKIRSGERLESPAMAPLARMNSGTSKRRGRTAKHNKQGPQKGTNLLVVEESREEHSADGELSDEGEELGLEAEITNQLKLPKLHTVRVSSDPTRSWHAGDKGLHSNWITTRDRTNRQKESVAERLNRMSAPRLGAPSPLLTFERKPYSMDAIATLVDSPNGLSAWEQRNSYLSQWCAAQGIQPSFEEYGPEDVGAVDAVWDQLPSKLQGVLKRDEVSRVLTSKLPPMKAARSVPNLPSSRPPCALAGDSGGHDMPRLLTPIKHSVQSKVGGRLQMFGEYKEGETQDGSAGEGITHVTPSVSAQLTRRLTANGTTLELNHYLYGHDQIIHLCSLIESHPRLQRLQLANNDLRDSEVTQICRTITRTKARVTEMDLSDNCLTYHAVKEVAELLRPPKRAARGTSKRLHLLKNASAAAATLRRLNPLESNGGGGPQSPSATPAAPPPFSLVKVNLSGNPIGNRASELLHELVVGRDVMLRVLDLSNCKITSLGAFNMGEFIGNNTSLQELKIGWNALGAKGSSLLVEGLKSNSTLTSLSMPWCGLSDIGGAEVASMLKLNFGLTCLDLSGNNLGDLSAVELGRSLESNTSMRWLLLHSNPIGWQGARTLLRATLGETIQGIELCNCHLLHRPGGAAEFDPRFPWGEYLLDLASPPDRVVAVQLADLTATEDSDSSKPRWEKAAVDGAKFTLEQIVSKDNPKLWHWSIPESGMLQVTVSRSGLATLESATAISDDTLKAMWEKSVAGQEGVTDEWKLSLLNVVKIDYLFTVDQLVAIVKSIEFPREQVTAAVSLFGRLVDPQNFDKLEAHLSASSLASLYNQIGLSRKFQAGNPTGHYDLVLSSHLDNAIAWRLLDAFRHQYRRGLCQRNASGYKMYCFVNVSIDGETITVRNPEKFEIPRSGLLALTFVDLSPPPPASEVLGDFSFRAFLGHLGEARRLDVGLIRRFLFDPELRYTAEGKHQLSKEVLRGDVPGKRMTILDKENFIHVLRALSVDMTISCDQLGRLLVMVAKAAELMFCPALVAEVAAMFWPRCSDRREGWQLVMRRMDQQQQVKFGQTLSYPAFFNPFKPNMYYTLRLRRPDDFHVLRALHNVAVSARVSSPYRDAFVFYPDLDAWLPLEEAIAQRCRDWNKGLTAVWEAFVDGVRDESVEIKTTVSFKFVVDEKDEMHAAAAFIQRTYRAFRDQKRYLTLMIMVDMVKMKLLQRLCRNIIRHIRARYQRAIAGPGENIDLSPLPSSGGGSATETTSMPQRAQEVVGELYAVVRDVSNMVVLLRSDPMGILAKSAAGKSMKLLRATPSKVPAATDPFGVDSSDDDDDAMARDSNTAMRTGSLRRALSRRAVGRKVKDAVHQETVSAWEMARRRLGVNSVSIQAFQHLSDLVDGAEGSTVGGSGSLVSRQFSAAPPVGQNGRQRDKADDGVPLGGRRPSHHQPHPRAPLQANKGGTQASPQSATARGPLSRGPYSKAGAAGAAAGHRPTRGLKTLEEAAEITSSGSEPRERLVQKSRSGAGRPPTMLRKESRRRDSNVSFGQGIPEGYHAAS